MLDFRTKMNSNCERGGRELLRQAKAEVAKRKDVSKAIADSAAKDMATYFRNKAVGRTHTNRFDHVQFNPRKKIVPGRWVYENGTMVKVA